jgi:hypothetical protein
MVILEIAKYAAAIMTIAGCVGMFIKWIVLKPLKLYIDTATAQISPTANGGRSLNDLVDKVDDLKSILEAHIYYHDTPK